MKNFVTLYILFITASTCFIVGCDKPGDIASGFQNEDPKVRISAIRRAGQEKDQSATPYLVDRLSDSEAEVRMFSIIALKEITGLTNGYRYYDPVVARDKAIEKWRLWLAADNNVRSAPKPVNERKVG
ncbi:MAG: hypothetical protein HN350_13770 [Phycisphaerales bacterium]|jgi:hypothetical protein|nr:hypothetical protein [Phycisphaerales bacterium]